MNNTNVQLTCLVSLSIITFTVCDTFAMTVQSVERAQRPQPAISSEQGEAIYLLSWTDNQLRTTQGTYSITKDINVINRSGLNKDEIFQQDSRPIVQFKEELGKIVQIIIFPNFK